VWAFSDESERAGVSLLAVVLVARKDLDVTRLSMRKLLLGRQRRIHTAKESPRRRRLILDTITRSEGISAIVLRHRRPAGVDRVAARAALIETATNMIVERDVTAWILDNMQPAERARDRNTIGRALGRAGPAVPVVFDHRPSHEEPLLWAADAICWATGAGGDWRRRIEAILTIIDIDP